MLQIQTPGSLTDPDMKVCGARAVWDWDLVCTARQPTVLQAGFVPRPCNVIPEEEQEEAAGRYEEGEKEEEEREEEREEKREEEVTPSPPPGKHNADPPSAPQGVERQPARHHP